MKNNRFLVFILTIGTLVLSACGGAAAPQAATAPSSVGSGKVEAMPVAFIGTVDSMAGDQWVISGTTVTVDPAVVRDDPFVVGDQVKVEGTINPDGSFTVSRVEVPSPEDATTLPKFGDDNSNDANVNDDNGNDVNINDDNGNANINDDNGNDVNINDDNGNSVNSNDTNTNDDHGGAGNTNDDNSNSVSPGNTNTNDNHGGKGGGGNDNGGGGKGGGGNDNGGGGNGNGN